MTDAELRAYSLGTSDERKRIALLMMNYQVQDHADDCACESCGLFSDIFRTGVPQAWLEGHNIDTTGMAPVDAG